MSTHPRKPVKCLVWDLDHTLWDGIIAEGDSVALRDGVLRALEQLDDRGILHSIASRNSHDLAAERLKTLGVEHFFLAPQINLGSKSQSIANIAQALSIGVDALAFIDDDPFERAEVAHSHPDVLCLDAALAAELPLREEFTPENLNKDTRRRRQMYQEGFERDRAEAAFQGPPVAFLQDLDLRLSIAIATEEDLDRAEELTLRTNQFNATGDTYSRDDLAALLTAPEWIVLIVNVADRFGDYGRVGLCLIEIAPAGWTVRLMLFSCRVLSRGMGGMMLNWIASQAAARNTPLFADFVPTDRNRAMLIAFRLAGYDAVGTWTSDARQTLRHDPAKIAALQKHLSVTVETDVVQRMDGLAQGPRGRAL